mgnify:CR=1 FL=1
MHSNKHKIRKANKNHQVVSGWQYNNPTGFCELLEIFQWQKENDFLESKINEVIIQDTKDEVADIFYYLLRICQKMDINLEEAFWDKMEKNKIKYPIDQFKGKSTKY